MVNYTDSRRIIYFDILIFANGRTWPNNLPLIPLLNWYSNLTCILSICIFFWELEYPNILSSFFQQKSLGFIIQNDGEINSDVNHCIQVGWLKWRRDLAVFCDTNVPFKLKWKNTRELSEQRCFMKQSIGG